MEGEENIHLPHQSRRSGLGFPEDSTEKLFGELESTLEKVADMESQIKTMKRTAMLTRRVQRSSLKNGLMVTMKIRSRSI
jgi:hypothetical protein